MTVFPILDLHKIAKDIKSRIKKNSDAVICISGFEGVGKSNFAIILSYLLDFNFDLWNNILYSPNNKELLDKLKNFNKGSILNLDEAVKVLEKQNWSKQTFIKKTFQIIRGRNLITLLLIPRLEDLNEYFRNWRVMLNICVIYRGLAYLQVPDPYNKFDVWNTKFNQDVLDLALKGETFHTAPTGDVLKAIHKFKGFIGFVSFPKLDSEIEKEYIKLKDKHSLLNLMDDDGNIKVEEKEKPLNRSQQRKHDTLLNLIHKRLSEGATQISIIKELGITRNVLRSWLGEN